MPFINDKPNDAMDVRAVLSSCRWVEYDLPGDATLAVLCEVCQVQPSFHPVSAGAQNCTFRFWKWLRPFLERSSLLGVAENSIAEFAARVPKRVATDC